MKTQIDEIELEKDRTGDRIRRGSKKKSEKQGELSKNVKI